VDFNPLRRELRAQGISDAEQKDLKSFGNHFFSIYQKLSFWTESKFRPPQTTSRPGNDLGGYLCQSERTMKLRQPDGLFSKTSAGFGPGKSIWEAQGIISKNRVAILSLTFGSNPSTFLQVTLGKFRYHQVNIWRGSTFRAHLPLECLSTVFNALYAAVAKWRLLFVRLDYPE